MEQLKKIWKQIDRRSLLTIMVVGAIALGFIFPIQPADLSQQLTTANQSIVSMDQQLSILITEINGVSSRLEVLEAKPDKSPELEAALASLENAVESAQGAPAKLEVLDFMLSNLTERVAQLEVGGVGYDTTFKTEVLQRLDALEDALDVEPPSSANYTITYSFDTDCSWQAVYRESSYGQQFVTKSWDFDVSSVSMYLSKKGSPAEAVITLYSTGSAGFPSGAPLWTKTVDPGSWSSLGKWMTFTVTGVVLPDYSTFVLAVACPNGNESNNISLGYNDDNGYSGGSYVGTLGKGVWTGPPSDVDFGFSINGERD